ncbi:hypothetical protein FEM48_Zijuj09G0211300 [Ziziphus jujuba var. spinosa]|uniref:Uncharacterized protein n=1 Tax=Ziziphus jujuba var. spinosa TaxID=714518 RepID=A0A978UVB8_ZIZJJ|nr:hypothetical protein FEM48_Zijuj09G0211300 [Ziziphus jujuba var. spinosa]
MRKKRLMAPLEEVDLPAVKYEDEEFQEPKPGVVMLDEEGKPEERVELASKSLPQYDPASCWNGDSTHLFKISDHAYAYRSGRATPRIVTDHVVSVINELSSKQPHNLC